MSERAPLRSEAEELGAVLAELETDAPVKEVAGLESGFSGLSRAINGILPGLYLLIGKPSCGKSAFARQLCDQVAACNSAPAMFFSFTESKKDLRVRTLARLSGVETREIYKGSAFLLHWYGIPKRRGSAPEELPPSWEKVKKTAEEAKIWLDLVYLFECGGKTGLSEIEEQIRQAREIKGSDRIMVVIDDSQRLGASDLSLDARLPIVSERLRALAADIRAPIVAAWPELKRDKDSGTRAPQEWGERVASADVVLVMAEDSERTKKLTQPNRAIDLHIVKNRGGERGKLAFDFMPSLAKFTEVNPYHEAER